MIERGELLNSLVDSVEAAMNGNQAGVWTAIPGIVNSVNFAQMTCSVQPSIQGIVTNEDGTTSYENLPLLINVPIVFPSAGGFLITLPLAQGDEVLVIFSCRAIDAWWQQGDVQPPVETRMHDLSDGFAIPGPRSIPKVVSGISSTGAQIRNNAGTTYIEISGNGKIKLVSPSEIDVTGDLKVTGTISATTDVTVGSVSLKNHLHPVVVPSTPFTGNTGAPL